MAQSARSKQKGLQKGLTLLFSVGFFLWLGSSIINNLLVPQLISLENPRYGVLQDRIDCQGTLVYEEKVLTAPQRGILKLMADEGERVRLGTNVAQVTTATIETPIGKQSFFLKAPITGLVSFRLDGLENILTIENLKELELSKIDKLLVSTREISLAEEVEKGEVVCKIVNNLESVYIYAQIGKNYLAPEAIQPGKVIQLQIGQEQSLSGWTIIDVRPAEDYYRLILENKRFREEFLEQRQIFFGIVTKSFEGFIIPEKALIKKDEEPGVYVKYKEALRWRPVEIVGGIGGDLAVKGLSPETQYVTNPVLAREGQPVQ